MKTLLASVVLLALAGCGSSGSSSPNTTPGSSGSVVGTWLDQLDSTDIILATFTANTWKVEIQSQLTDGTYGLQTDSGTYTAATDTLTLTMTASTCEGVTTVNKVAAAPFTRRWSVLKMAEIGGAHELESYLIMWWYPGDVVVNLKTGLYGDPRRDIGV